MKVSEAIDRLEVGDTVWVRATVDKINFTGRYIKTGISKTYKYLDGDAEISLAEPQAEKVEVPDYVAEWIEYAKKKGHAVIESANPWDLYGAEYSKADIWIKDNQDSFARAFMDGYTVKPKRWVVKAGDYHSTYVDSLTITSEKSRHTISGKEKAHYFTDKSKAEAVATLVEGTVEEID